MMLRVNSFNNKIKLLYKFLFIIIIINGACQKSQPLYIEPIDDDKDGHTRAKDCNDHDPSINPGAIELGLDGVDNNCDGRKDEDVTIEIKEEILKKIIIETLVSNEENPTAKIKDHNLTNNEIANLKFLFASNRSIIHLDGLEYAHKLSNLDLSHNQINDILPIVKNIGLKGSGVKIDLEENNLDADDCENIKLLFSREVTITTDLTCEKIIDFDGDGYGKDEDCDNSNFFVHPGAPEIYGDKIDNNCSKVADEPEEVKFDDHDLRKAVIEELELIKYKKDRIYNYEISELKKLRIYHSEIISLRGLEYAYNLTELKLSDNEIEKLGPIKNLINLSELILRNNNIKDLSAIDKLKNLTYLDLGNNKIIQNISALSNLKLLNTLFLNNNSISEISSLKTLKKLTSLSLQYNNIKNIAPLAELKSLTFLNLENNILENISVIDCLENLDYLNLRYNKIIDISPIEDLRNLSILKLDDNRIYDISSLESLVNLQHLILRTNDITNISAISGLNNLQRLVLSDNYISNIKPIVYNVGITGVNDYVELLENPLARDDCDELAELFDRNINLIHGVYCY